MRRHRRAFHRLGGGAIKRTVRFAKDKIKEDKTAWQRFEEADLLPNSLGVSKTKSLFSTVLDAAYKEDPSIRRTFGMPDNIVVEDGRITIVEEAQMWTKRESERLAQLAKEDPSDFIRKG